MVDFQFKENYNFYDFVEIMKLLRAPGGCPWDAEQTHESIRKNLIEETYEVIEAIDNKDSVLLEEELGDLLMQVIFHTLMEEEKGKFDIDKVADGIAKKMIIRHPHIFGNVSADTVDEVLTNWDEIKKKTKGQKTTSDSMLSVPRQFPALMRAEKLQKKASKVGFDWADVSGALDKLQEEIDEVRQAVASGVQKDIDEEIGDLLFSAVNVSRFTHTDPEEALTFANDKFLARFQGVEKKCIDRKIDMKNSSLDVLDAIWDEVKEEMKN